MSYAFCVCSDNPVFAWTKRQGAVGGKGQRIDPERRTRESRAIPAPDANAELVMSMQVLCEEYPIVIHSSDSDATMA